MFRQTSRYSDYAARLLLATLVLLVAPVTGTAQGLEKDTRPPLAPDIREDEMDLKLQRGDFVAVPIPLSNPLLGAGLIAGAAYFYPQTEEQKAVQPASLTGIAGMYSENGSKAVGIAQQNYWSNNRWRFTGAVGAADMKLRLLTAAGYDVDWRLKGKFFFTRLSGQVRKNWYTGFMARFVDVDQNIQLSALTSTPSQFSLLPEIRSVGVGAYLEFDTRDMPTNAYSGRYLKVDALFNDESLGSDKTYQNYNLIFNTYHQLNDSLVLAGQVRGCLRGGSLPLWDACTISLRGFPATDYMGTGSMSGQAEARWRFSERWGLVGFAGGGYAKDLFSTIDNRSWIPSYGLGLRFMVLKSKRINMRLDYARSLDNDAIHFFVGEAF